MFNRFAWSMAWRHLRHNVGQTILTMCIVAVSVVLIIMLRTLIGGIQTRLISAVTDSMAHVTIEPLKREPIAMWQLPKSQKRKTLYVGTSFELAQRKRKIEDWSRWLPRLKQADPNILAVSPVVQEQAILFQGAQPRGVAVVGVQPDSYNRVVALQSKITEGSFLGLRGGRIVIGESLAEDLSLKLGDKIRIVASNKNTNTYTISGIYYSGMRRMDKQTVFLPIRDAQSLFQLGNAVTSISIKLKDVFEANNLADRLKYRIPYEVNSWMRDNSRLLSAMESQGQTTLLILIMTTIAAGFAIASILIMAVVSKLKELGILKAMGATRKQIIAIFTIQGTLLSALGAILGSIGGIALTRFLFTIQSRDESGRLNRMFSIELEYSVVLLAIGIAIFIGWIAALYPAWKASRIDPIEVIRGA
tara:strand:- start:1513 stop:2766 length:1254 start_codon:yes stop_codon:yes gene_type:complete